MQILRYAQDDNSAPAGMRPNLDPSWQGEHVEGAAPVGVFGQVGHGADEAARRGRVLGDQVPGDDGAAVVVHAAADDYQTQPSGNSGDRIACGVVQG